MIAIAQEHPLWTTRQVWLGRAAAVPLALALNACLLTAAAIQQFFIVPLPEPHVAVVTDREPIRLPPPKPEKPWPDLRALICRPAPPPLISQLPSDQSGIFRLQPGVTPPEPIFQPAPSYPRIARDVVVQGHVIIEAIVDHTGKVIDARVLRGIGFGCTEAALDAVRKWRYRPATANGKPASVYFTETFVFHLT